MEHVRVVVVYSGISIVAPRVRGHFLVDSQRVVDWRVGTDSLRLGVTIYFWSMAVWSILEVVDFQGG